MNVIDKTGTSKVMVSIHAPRAARRSQAAQTSFVMYTARQLVLCGRRSSLGVQNHFLLPEEITSNRCPIVQLIVKRL